jgi:hypothetical protein
MPIKLLKSKWYVVDLSNRRVAVDHHYDHYWDAVETERGRGRMQRFTAFTGAHITAHAGRLWIIPLTLEEAEDERQGD